MQFPCSCTDHYSIAVHRRSHVYEVECVRTTRRGAQIVRLPEHRSIAHIKSIERRCVGGNEDDVINHGGRTEGNLPGSGVHGLVRDVVAPDVIGAYRRRPDIMQARPVERTEKWGCGSIDAGMGRILPATQADKEPSLPGVNRCCTVDA